ncbi:BTB/POZ domain-containing protein 17-like [Lineus longissimus]|uniref:BTB/POZ domain-containing protein 17-like n=1 Tax=Lineus longissimus TaxID=88925 RepID=UPI00315DEFF8
MPIVRSEKTYKDVYSYKDRVPSENHTGTNKFAGKWLENDVQELTMNEGKSAFHHEHGQLINNSYKVLQRFAMLYESQEFCDIQLIVGQQVHFAHKLILCQSSKVFLVMLRSPMWPESQGNQVLLKEEPECCQVFGQFLRYLYTGVIQLTHDNVLPLLILGDKYFIADLSQICVNYMCEHIVSDINHNRAVSWYRYAVLKEDKRLAGTCKDFITWNFHKVLSTVQYLQMEADELIQFLRSSELVIPDEYTLFSCIKNWIFQRQHLDCVKYTNTALDIMSWIRFPMIQSNQLVSMQSDPIVAIHEEFFMEKISNALNYHSYPKEIRNHMDLPSNLFCPDAFKPRNYTNDFWGTTFYVEHFHSLQNYSVQTLMFFTPVSGSETDEETTWEWAVDVYPKGVLFPKCLMIGWTQNYEIEGAAYDTVRLAIMSKSTEHRAVEIVLLVTGVQDNIEFTKNVVKKRMVFDEDDNVYNVNDIVPYVELNDCRSSYLSGVDGDVFKITLIIKPCCE